MSNEELKRRIAEVTAVHRKLVAEVARHDQHLAGLDRLIAEAQRLRSEAELTHEAMRRSAATWAMLLEKYPADALEADSDDEFDGADWWKQGEPDA